MLRRVKPEEKAIRSALLKDLQNTVKGVKTKMLGDHVAKMRYAKGGTVEDKKDEKEDKEEMPVNEFMREEKSDGPSDADATKDIGVNLDTGGPEQETGPDSEDAHTTWDDRTDESDEDEDMDYKDDESDEEDKEESLDDLIRAIGNRKK